MNIDSADLIPDEYALLDIVTNEESLVVEIAVRDTRLSQTCSFRLAESDDHELSVHTEPATHSGHGPAALFGWLLLVLGIRDSTTAAHVIRAFSAIESCEWARASSALATSTIETEDFGEDQEACGPVWYIPLAPQGRTHCLIGVPLWPKSSVPCLISPLVNPAMQSRGGIILTVRG